MGGGTAMGGPEAPDADRQSAGAPRPVIPETARLAADAGVKQTPGVPVPSALDESVRALHLAGVVNPPANPGLLGNLGRYELLHKIGEGGMGFVFLARDGTSGERVAVKILRPDLARDEAVAHRFLKEPRHMMQLAQQCPHILPVLAVGDPADGSYFVMPHCAGGSLAGLIREHGPLPGERVLALCQPLAQALVCAHRCGIIHRDLKPANILLDAGGKPYLADFGLVRTLFDESLVRIGQPEYVGTLPYMSPAVAAGEAEDTRCDIYAFGAMMYEMLTARPPYEGRDREELRQRILAGPPPPIAGHNPAAHPELVRIAAKAMARDLRDRYTSMAELLRDLEFLEKNRGKPGVFRRRSRNLRNQLLAMAAGVVLVAGTAVLARRMATGDPGNPPPAVSPALVATPAPAASATSLPAAEVEVLPATLVPATATGTPALAVTRYIPMGSGLAGICLTPDERRVYAAVWGNEHGAPIEQYEVSTGKKTRVFPYSDRYCHADAVLSPDGRYLFTTHYYFTHMSRIDLETGKEARLHVGGVRHAVWAGGIAIAPSGTLLAVALGKDGRNYDMKNDQISLISIRDGEFRLTGEVKLDDEPTGRKMAFTADSQWLYVVTMPRQTAAARLYEIALSEPYRVTRRLDFPDATLTGVAVSPADDRVYVSDARQRQIRGVNRESWTAESAFTIEGAAPDCLLFAQDGRRLFAAAEAIRTLFMLDTRTGNVVGRLAGLGKGITDLEIGHDGETLYLANGGDESGVAIVKVSAQPALPMLVGKDGFPIELLFASDRAGNYQLYGADREGVHVRRLMRNLYTEIMPRWSPDRRRIGFMSDRNGPCQLFVLDPETGDVKGIPDTMVRDMRDGAPFDWAPNGSAIAFIRPDRSTLCLADLAGGTIRTLYQGTANPRYSCLSSLSWDWYRDRILVSANNADSGHLGALLAVDPRSGTADALSEGINAPHAQAAAAPDGRVIALTWTPDVLSPYRNLAFLDGLAPNRIRRGTQWRRMDSLPRWSRDGTALVFASGIGQKTKILVRHADRDVPVEVTTGAYDDCQPDLR